MAPLTLSPALWVAVDSLATARLTTLVTADIITVRPRHWVAQRSMAWFDFLSCGWCTSIWLAAGVVLATVFLPGAWVYPAAGLAFSEVAGLASALGH